MTNFAVSNILFLEYTTLNNILFTHKFLLHSIQVSVRQAQNVEVSSLC